jgi:heme exporter protein C
MSKVLTQSQPEVIKAQSQQTLISQRRLKLEWALCVVSIVLLALTYYLGIWVTPPDLHLGQSVRLLYIHPATAWVALYFCFGLTTLASFLYLIPKTRKDFFDRLSQASAESGIIFLILTTVVGSIWGHITWGIWWTWDARLTSTALLAVLYLGYIAVRQIPGSYETQKKRSAIFALFAAIDLPVVHYSVDWWNTLHQRASVFTSNLHFKVHGIMLYTMLLSFVAFSLLYLWIILMKFDILKLESFINQHQRELALKQRRQMD